MRNKEIVPIVTSVNMDDYLSVTMTNNRPLFENYCVATSPKDESTIRLCKELGAEPILYEHFFDQPGCSFNKSGGIRQAQRRVHDAFPDKWILILDTDILLPDSLASLDVSGFNKRWMYGARRMDANTIKDHESGRYHQYACVFAGYFQLYHNKHAYYEEISKDASGCDMDFRDKFSRRIPIDDISVIHMGRRQSHWFGRSNRRLEWRAGGQG